MMQMIIALVKLDNLARHIRAIDVIAIQLANRVWIHVSRMQCPLFPKRYFKPLKKSVGTASFDRIDAESALGSRVKICAFTF